MSEQAPLQGVQATRWLLGLSAAQIRDALQEANNSMDLLTGSVTELMDAVRQVDDQAQIRVELSNLPEDSPLRCFDGYVVEYVQQVVTALQFYDRLSQRMQHVAEGLGDLASLAGDSEGFDHEDSWQRLLDGINARYSTAEERSLLEQQLPKAPLRYVLPAIAASEDDDIELF